MNAGLHGKPHPSEPPLPVLVIPLPEGPAFHNLALSCCISLGIFKIFQGCFSRSCCEEAGCGGASGSLPERPAEAFTAEVPASRSALHASLLFANLSVYLSIAAGSERACVRALGPVTNDRPPGGLHD